MGYVQPSSKGKTFRARTKVGARLVSKSFPTRSEAWAWLERVETGVEPAGGDLRPDPVTLEAVPAPLAAPTLAQWLDDGGFVTGHLRQSTAETYSALMKPVVAAFGDRPLEDITRAEFQQWLLTGARKSSRLDAAGKPRMRSATSVKHIKKVAHSMFEAALDAGLISENPARGAKVLRDDEPYDARFLTKEELQILLNSIERKYRGFVLLGGYGGLRPGETLGLRWRNLNLQTGRIKIAECATEIGGRVVLGPPKTKKGLRTFTLPKVALEGLREHRNVWRLAGNRTGPDDFVVPNSEHGVMAQRNFRKGAWKRAVAAAGIGKVLPHELRHTAISLWIAAGIDPKEVSQRAGHESVAFTLDRYGHLYEEHDEQATSKLDEYLAG